MNGYFYQRIYAIILLFENYENKTYKINEEGNEDIDIIDDKNNITVYQTKYHGTNTKESLTKSSGLLKVIQNNYNNNKIIKIYYCSYNSNKEQTYTENLSNYFKYKQYDILSKYVLLLCYNNELKKTKNTEEIQTNGEIEKLFDSNKYKIEKNLKRLYDFFTDIKKYTEYFNKIILICADSYDVIMDKIYSHILLRYTHIEIADNIKCQLIFGKIFNILMSKMFDCPGKKKISERTLLINDIFNKCNTMIISDSKMPIDIQFLKSIETTLENIDIRDKKNITKTINAITPYIEMQFNNLLNYEYTDIYKHMNLCINILNLIIAKHIKTEEYIKLIDLFKTMLHKKILQIILNNSDILITEYRMCIKYFNNILINDKSTIKKIKQTLFEKNLKIFLKNK